MDKIVGKISTELLLNINEAAKALKQKQFSIFNCNVLVGLDNIDVCFKYTTMTSVMDDESQILENTIFNLRELSNFVKNITIETEFDIIDNNNKYIIKVSNIEMEMYKLNFNIMNRFINLSSCIQNLKHETSLECINDNISKLFEMRKDDGCLYYIHKNIYYITLFPGLLPLNKSDTVYLEIYSDVNTNSFIAHFIVKKKKYSIDIFIRYLKV